MTGSHRAHLQERGPDRPPQAALRDRTDRQGVPQRDHARKLHLPHARVRAHGGRVLRPAGGRGRVAPLLDRPARRVAPPLRPAREPPARPPARAGGALALLLGDERHRVPLPDRLVRARGHRETAATSTSTPTPGLRDEARVGGRPGALHAARRRARARRQPLDARVHGRRVRRGGRRRARADRAPAAPRAGAREGRGAPADPEERRHGRKARSLFEELRRAVVAEYDDSGQIGRRYRRQDEIGTPYALTIDDQTLEDDTVTIRDRDSLAQERIPISGARAFVQDKLAEDWRTPKPDE